MKYLVFRDKKVSFNLELKDYGYRTRLHCRGNTEWRDSNDIGRIEGANFLTHAHDVITIQEEHESTKNDSQESRWGTTGHNMPHMAVQHHQLNHCCWGVNKILNMQLVRLECDSFCLFLILESTTFFVKILFMARMKLQRI